MQNAITTRRRTKKSVKKDHWLDYSEEKYGKELVEDIKATLKVLVLYLPLPVFWALFDQQGTGWTFQARRMNGDLGFYTILPDQMQVVNPLLILIFIPLFQYIIYPLFDKCGFLTKPLQRLVVGGLLAAVAFAMSACISLAIEAENPVLPTSSSAQLRIYNNLNCKLELSAPGLRDGKIVIDAFDYYENNKIELANARKFQISDSSSCLGNSEWINLEPNVAAGYYFQEKKWVRFEDDIDKAEKGLPKFR